MHGAEVVSREEIRKEVIAEIRLIVKEGTDIKESSRLERDLRMGASVRQIMATTLTRISKKYGGAAISPTESGDLVTVGEAITLVYDRANGRSR
jgi:hypothetical protein